MGSHFYSSSKMGLNSDFAAIVVACLIGSLDAGYVSQKTQPQPQCHTEYETVTSYEQRCDIKYERECNFEPHQRCSPKVENQCQTVDVQECNTRYERECTNREVSQCEISHETECETTYEKIVLL